MPKAAYVCPADTYYIYSLKQSGVSSKSSLIMNVPCKTHNFLLGCFFSVAEDKSDKLLSAFKSLYFKMVDYLKKALIYGHTSRISS